MSQLRFLAADGSAGSMAAIVAVHDSAHAVAGLRLGLPLDFIRLTGVTTRSASGGAEVRLNGLTSHGDEFAQRFRRSILQGDLDET